MLVEVPKIERSNNIIWLNMVIEETWKNTKNVI